MSAAPEPRRRLAAVVLAGIALAAAGGIAAVLLVNGGGRSAPAGPSGTTVAARPGVAAFAAPSLVQVFLAAATSDVAAVSSYDYRRLDDTLAAGLAVTTGRYRSSFRASLTGAAARRIVSSRTVETFTVQRIGIGAMSADGSAARVLVYGVQAIAADGGAPKRSPVVLTATLQRQGRQYAISDLAVAENAGLPPGTAGLDDAAEAAREAIAARGGPVIAVAVESATGSQAVVMVVATRDGRDLRYEVSVVHRTGGWTVVGADTVAPS